MNNLPINSRPDGMSIAEAAEILKEQRENERRGLMFAVATALAGSKSGSSIERFPKALAAGVREFVDYLLTEAYQGGLPCAADPTQQLAEEIAEEAARDFDKQGGLRMMPDCSLDDHKE